MRGARLAAALFPALLAPAARDAAAEPYLALRDGLACSACHVNRTGGGLRTPFGAGVGRESLPWWIPSWSEGAFDGSLHPRVRVGADLRAGYFGILPADEENHFVGEFRVAEGNVYLAVDVIPERLAIVVDERVAPGGAGAREAFALVRIGPEGLYAKAGKFQLPFGWRLQDDDAETRRRTGRTFDSADLGIEIGADPGPFTLAAAVTNGTDGGAETDNGKQAGLRAEYVSSHVRGGVSGSVNDLPGAASRRLTGVFGGARTGPVLWLAEWDRIEDRAADGSRLRGSASHAEAVWLARRGLAVRAWFGRFDPDRDVAGNALDQMGIGADWTPLPGLQVRAYYRGRNGPVAAEGSRDDRVAVEIHVYF